MLLDSRFSQKNMWTQTSENDEKSDAENIESKIEGKESTTV